MASKLFKFRWIKTGSHPYKKTLSSIVLQLVFYEYKNYNNKIKTIFLGRAESRL